MEVFETILTRRSIRQFEEKEIPKSTLENILKAAMMAPSAHNRQSWAFLVIDDRSILKEIPSIHPHSDMCKEASLAILVLGDRKKEPLEGFCIQNLAAASQNILLSAHGFGLGSVWMGIYPHEELMEAFKKRFLIPDHLFAFSLIAIGYAKEKRKAEDRFDKKRIFYNKC